ncbi:hypothetical protein FQZ97_1064880 [compost metagenome]
MLTLLTCCWKITLGNRVVITAVGICSPSCHQGSGTMSRKRLSSSSIAALKLDTCVTCAAWPLAWPMLPRVETMAAWRWCASMRSSLLLSARQRPKVTNQVCSRPGW